MRCLPSKGGLWNRRLSMTPMNTAKYRSYHGFQPRTDSMNCFHNPYLTPLILRPETSKNRRALLVRGGRIGDCDPDALTCKPYHLLNLPETHHIPPLKILSKSRLFPLGYAWGILSRLHLRNRHTSDSGANCAIAVGVRNFQLQSRSYDTYPDSESVLLR